MTVNLTKLALNKIKQAKCTKKLVVFTVASTAKQESEPFLSPLREYDQFCVLGCVIFNQTSLVELLVAIDGLVDVVLVDAEKKIPIHLGADTGLDIADSRTIGSFETGNFSKLCFTQIKKSLVFEYKPNDLTVNAAWMFLSQKLHSFTGKKISLLGLGNIGSKLALKLVECGADVHVYSRDYFKSHLIIQALNLIKPIGTIATITCHREPLPASFASDVLIGATNGHPIITDEIITSVNKNCLIVDLGKNNLTKSAVAYARECGLEICRTDVTSSLQTFVTETLSLNNALVNDYGERIVSGQVVVGGGYFGQLGSIVVDSINSPTRVFGIADGKGSLKQKLANSERADLAVVAKYFKFKDE
jgi:hypothetical protein